MFEFNSSFSNIYLSSDLTPEVRTLIGKHTGKQRNGYVWHIELGKDLVNYTSRPDFLTEVIHYLRTYGADVLYSVVSEFLNTITSPQIKSLIETKLGWALVDEIQGWLTVSGKPFDFPSVDKNQLARMNLKVDAVRVPIIANDQRPYVGDMVAKDEDLGIHTSRVPKRSPFYTYRFGGGHDGEHWLTKTIGAEVRATAGIKGIVLTIYNQEGGLWTVMILLDDTNVVLLLKDFLKLGAKIQQGKIRTFPDNAATKTINESMFTDRQGKPVSNIRVEAGDLIGTTTTWENGKYGTFHFALLKYEKVQEYRTKVGAGASGVGEDDLVKEIIKKAKMLQMIAKVPIPLSWFISALSPESPVKCFK